MPAWENPLITIIGEKCRACYACVRECPAKAIKVENGRASVIQPRCIGCGNCLRVCTQNAKQVRDDTQRAFSLIESGEPVSAMVAPSFPAEFVDIPPGTLVAMIRALGFTYVHEVALGADMVAHMYRKLLDGTLSVASSPPRAPRSSRTCASTNLSSSPTWRRWCRPWWPRLVCCGTSTGRT